MQSMARTVISRQLGGRDGQSVTGVKRGGQTGGKRRGMREFGLQSLQSQQAMHQEHQAHEVHVVVCGIFWKRREAGIEGKTE